MAGGEGNGEMWKMLAPGIKQVKLKNKDNEVHGISGGNDTADRIFCLSIDEVKVNISKDTLSKLNTVYSKAMVIA